VNSRVCPRTIANKTVKGGTRKFAQFPAARRHRAHDDPTAYGPRGRSPAPRERAARPHADFDGRAADHSPPPIRAHLARTDCTAPARERSPPTRELIPEDAVRQHEYGARAAGRERVPAHAARSASRKLETTEAVALGLRHRNVSVMLPWVRRLALEMIRNGSGATGLRGRGHHEVLAILRAVIELPPEDGGPWGREARGVGGGGVCPGTAVLG